MNEKRDIKPIDDLFARKLGNMSLPPSADGFERLQARMGKTKPEVKMVFWRNPDIQRYMAVAACLLLVCLFAWLYQSSPGSADGPGHGAQVATTEGEHPAEISQPSTDPTATSVAPAQTPLTPTVREFSEGQLAEVGKPEVRTESKISQRSSAASVTKNTETTTALKEQPVLAQTNRAETPTNVTPTQTPTVDVPAISLQTTPQRLAENTAKPAPVAERGLVVTIEEPAALVAARQVARTLVADNATAVAVATPTQQTEKEPKTGGLWQQVKKLKQGDVFARHTNDDRGLLSRAYDGLKQSFDKDDKPQTND